MKKLEQACDGSLGGRLLVVCAMTRLPTRSMYAPLLVPTWRALAPTADPKRSATPRSALEPAAMACYGPKTDAQYCIADGSDVITAAQIRAARALLGMDQRALAEAAGLSVPTIQRMEASEGVVRGHVDSLMKLVTALNLAGVELISEGTASQGAGRGVRLKT